MIAIPSAFLPFNSHLRLTSRKIARSARRGRMNAMCAMSAEAIASALAWRKVSASSMAQCPAHDDREPSLAIRSAGNGKVLVRCHADCGRWKVTAALQSLVLWDELARPNRLHARKVTSPDERLGRDDYRRTETTIAISGNVWPAIVTLVT
ncbi:hypothetical protein G5V57_18040 [Nordella sp. HKS 07]|uniref:hypothetical protein n=1 Tax=Nordella sp. HKS 07 TaxID=2712222 RepID=UPI0013E155B0|nr:hypothetical protein [Nordella sp. HKS 07]QIG49449.1 hypothetical protein G5V57_18040 [Nordella sp. HKS 07]